MTLINKLQIERFRGVRDLSIDRLSQINLIVGDNNCGKTSLLEAIHLLRAPGSLANIYTIVKLREALLGLKVNSVYDSFVCMFPKDEDVLKIQLSCEYDGNSFSYVLFGEESREILDINELPKIVRREFYETEGETETDVFNGQIVYTINGQTSSESIRLNRLSRRTGTLLGTNELIKIRYAAPYEHLKGNSLRQIVKDDRLKKSCLRALRLFDADIEDVKIVPSDVSPYWVEYLAHKRLGSMPLSTYGDGIKKILFLSNAIAESANGVLLIDEIETSIHKQYYDPIFRYLVNACKEFNVQAFIATHSLEAVDGLLNTQDYGTQDADDDITVVTLEREEGKTYSRVLPGRRVFNAREAFDFEVRL